MSKKNAKTRQEFSNKKRQPTASSRRGVFFAAAAAAAAVLSPAPASALENFLPYLPGLTLGLPVGAMAPGLFFANNLYWVNGEIRNGAGDGVARISAEVDLPLFCYDTGLKLFGASYGITLVTPVSAVQLRPGGGGAQNAAGVFNPYFSPIDLSWQLNPNLFVSAAFGVYLPIGSYHATAPLNIANNYATFEPSVGVSYLKNGWTLSTALRVDFNTVNTADHYHSGNIFLADYSVKKSIGAWQLGVGGYVADQFTDDTIDGLVVPASASISRGRKAFSEGLGPLVEYDFGKSSITATYQHDFQGRNYGAGDDVFLRFATMLD
jgi:hypothetical protein